MHLACVKNKLAAEHINILPEQSYGPSMSQINNTPNRALIGTAQRSKVSHCLLGIVVRDVTNGRSCRLEDADRNVAIKGTLGD